MEKKQNVVYLILMEKKNNEEFLTNFSNKIRTLSIIFFFPYFLLLWEHAFKWANLWGQSPRDGLLCRCVITSSLMSRRRLNFDSHVLTYLLH